jgi:hypothetical protein
LKIITSDESSGLLVSSSNTFPSKISCHALWACEKPGRKVRVIIKITSTDSRGFEKK